MSETPDCPVCGYAMPAHEWACWIGNMVAANTALTAKSAMLTAERDLFFDQHAPLAAENERLRAALTHITCIGPLGVDTYPECYGLIQKCAVAALAKDPTP